MPGQYVLVPSPDATVSFVLTGGAGTVKQYECQVTSAAVTMTANTTTVPATGCAGPAVRNLPPTYGLVINFLQDWGQIDSLSQFLWDNQLADADFVISLAADPLVPVVSGTCQLIPGDYGGDFANPLAASSTMPIEQKPTIAPAAVTAEADEGADEGADEYATVA